MAAKAAGRVIVGAAARAKMKPLRDPITITETAAWRIQSLLEKNKEAVGVRLAVKAEGVTE